MNNTQALAAHVGRASDIRERLVLDAKAKGPSAAFHLKMVRMGQAIERAQKILADPSRAGEAGEALDNLKVHAVEEPTE